MRGAVLTSTCARLPVRCSGKRKQAKLRREEVALLERYWKSRGVQEAEQRRRLIQVAQGAPPQAAPRSFELYSGLSYVWNLDRLRPEVLERRSLAAMSTSGA